LRRRFLFPAHPAETQLERWRLSRRVSCQQNRQTSPRGFKPSPTIRRSNQINPTGIAMTMISIMLDKPAAERDTPDKVEIGGG
jgi:hypothetical protein